MDNQDSQTLDENSDSHKFDKYVQLALNIGEQHTRSRGGFGAFRQFQDICRNSMGLVFESGFFANNNQTPFQLLDDEFFLDFYMRRGRFRPNFKYFFEQVLTNPSSYNPVCLWSLFWALAKAEHEFLLRYTPYWSHEERLTGHLVSQMITRLEDFEVYWAALEEENETQDKSHCRIHYMDTATARRESLTGADLGLIIQARFSRHREFFKAVRFQAKKVDKGGNARIDLNQADTLIKTKNIGYYLFYHHYDVQNWSLPPIVQPASNFDHYVEESRNNKNKLSMSKDIELGEKSVGVTSNGYDFATFITFALADQASEHGVLAASAEEATRLLMATNRGLPQLSRIVVVTLGSQTTEIDWDRLFVEYIARGDLQ
jgi:hypothetical protein